MVFREIDKLPPNCREIFLMSRIEGLSHKEISGFLDISAKTVENQVGIALRKIRNGVKD
ncbi:MAG TPA: RNA polymerase sigma-70 factor, partial [Bacteroidetes bacterium]|nr:RNA polymerase sigma-70 factor [Bacteroidota bacterium]